MGNLVCFGAFELDLRARELRKHGLKIRLPEQSIQVLAMLLERPGQVVLREEIQKKLWPNDTIVEFDHSINAAVKRLRRALGDEAETPRYVETLPRRGYRFIYPVDTVGPGLVPAQPGHPHAVPLQVPSITPEAHPAGAAAPALVTAAAPGSTDLTGRTVSHYLVLGVVGEGGMGVVYQAEDIRLGRRVALKFLPDELIDNPQALERFEREARAASTLNHPNICTIYEVEEHEGKPFIVMELLEGQTLRERLTPILTPNGRGASDGRGEVARCSPLGLDEMLDLAIQIADGLEAAHQKGITHRDIKPANIFITTRGQAKILDFGLAQLTPEKRGLGPRDSGLGKEALQEMPTATARTAEEHLTRSGATMGTAAYMSPEQIRGEKLDARTDLFSFGSVLYEMATGRQAFSGNTSGAIFEALLREAPTPPLSVKPDLPPKLEEIIHKALEKDRELRYQHASEIRADLKRLKRDTDSVSAGAGLVPAPEAGPPGTALRRWLMAAGLVVIAAAAGTYLYLGRRQPRHLTERDTVVFADFTNQTGDSIWDYTLKQGLAVALRQSPFLNILPDDQVAATLRLMERPPGSPMAGEVAREVCQRAGSRAYIAGSIAALGNQYVLGLKAVGCVGGETLAEEQATAAGKENVMDALDHEAAKLREKLGESLASVQKFDTPLTVDTTSSLEALRAYTLGEKARDEADDAEAIPFFQRAIGLDPNFAMAHEQLGVCYVWLGETVRGTESIKKAFELRDRVSEPEKLHINLEYYAFVLGDLQKAMENEKLGIATYPRAGVFHGGLGAGYARLGQYESAISSVQQAIALSPHGPIAYEVLMDMYIALDRLDQARSVYEQAKALGLSVPDFHLSLYILAFVQHDAPAMEREAAFLDSTPGLGNEIPCARASSEAYYGRSRKARELTQRAVKSIAGGGFNETAATCLARRAFEEALAGETAAAQEDAAEALNRAAGRDVETLAAFAFASSGEVTRAQRFATDLARRFPLDTLLNSVCLPTLRAGLAIRRGDAARALESLEPVRPFDTGFWALVPMYPAYVRGEAYLRRGQGDKAAEQFQQVLDHPGLVGNCPVGALARVGLARAYALEAGADGTAVAAVKNHGSNTGETPVPQQDARAKARAAYQDFFTLWKDADPDIPILQQAKAEYAKLK